MSVRKRRRKRNAGTGSVMFIVIAFLAVMSIQIYRMKQKDAAYAAQEQKLMEQYEAETERTKEIDELAEYMQTKQYIEDIATSKLGLAYENEIIFKESKEKQR